MDEDTKDSEPLAARAPLHRSPSKPLQNVDDLYNKLGEPGRLQVLLFFLLAFNMVVVGSNHVVGVFFGYSPVHICDAPLDLIETKLDTEVGSASYNVDLHTPVTDNITASSHESQNQTFKRDSCFKTLEGVRNLTRACTSGQWKYEVYEGERTIVTDFDLVCDHSYLSKLANTLYFVGVMLGGFACGYVSDTYGRKPVLAATLVLSLAVGVAISFANHYALFTVLRVLMGALMQGLLTSSFILAIELFPVHHRSLAGVTAQVFWGIGILYLGGAAWIVKNWRYIQLALLGPIALSAASVWFQVESLRWLLAKGKTHRASLVVKKITSFNNLPNPIGDEHSLLAEYKVHYEKSSVSYLTLFRTPVLRKRTVFMSFIWFSANACYFGMSYSSAELAGNRYLSFLLGGVTDTIVLIIAGIVVVRYGRRRPLIACFLVGGICCLIAGVIPRDSEVEVTGAKNIAITVFTIAGKSAMCGLFVVMDIFASELFPTIVRNMGVGVCTLMARTGAVLAPQIFVLSDLTISQLPYLLFAALAVTGVILTYFLPETSGQHLPDTVEDVETNFGWKSEHNETDTEKHLTGKKEKNYHHKENGENEKGKRQLLSKRVIFTGGNDVENANDTTEKEIIKVV